MALQEAQAIFGDADELLEQFRAATARSGQQPEASEEEGDDGLDEADLAADEDAQAERLRTTVGSCILALAMSLPLPVSASWPAWWALCHALQRQPFSIVLAISVQDLMSAACACLEGLAVTPKKGSMVAL